MLRLVSATLVLISSVGLVVLNAGAADSENNRIVEYQRVDGRWTESWTWRDERMEWPRDADRLPDGNTLVTDTHSDRVFEVTPSGEIEWSLRHREPYEAERLGTGTRAREAGRRVS